MPPNPLDALKALGEQLRQTVGDELADQLDSFRKPESTRTMEELQAELDSLTGLETVKEQVRALVAFLQVQARRKEHGLAEVGDEPAPRLPRQPRHRQDDRRATARARCIARWAC